MRVITEEFLTSDKVNRLDYQEEVFFHRLLQAADDYGRYYASPVMLINIMPRRKGCISTQDTERLLAACVKAGLVRVYAAKRKLRLRVLQFNKMIQER